MNESMWIDENTGKIFINPNVDEIFLPKDILDELQKFISDEIDNEILRNIGV